MNAPEFESNPAPISGTSESTADHVSDIPSASPTRAPDESPTDPQQPAGLGLASTIPEEVPPSVEFLETASFAPMQLPGRRRVATTLPDMPGYEVLSELGRGGMGVVYKARDRKLPRLVALKMVLTDRADAPTLQRFRLETEAVARLQHPNIVGIYEVGEHHGQPYCALEFVEGGSLDRFLDNTPQPGRESAALVRVLALAMHAAHEKNIVHRDLKPANVLMAGASEAISTFAGLRSL